MKLDTDRRAEHNLADGEDALQEAMEEILRSIKNVRFGSIEIIIHDSRVVQIERKEKMRFAPPPRLRAH